MKRSLSAVLGVLTALAIAPAALTLTGCRMERTERVRAGEPTLILQPTARTIYSGEIVTITTESRNLLGRDAEIRWATTGGELETEDAGRIARVRFDRPGNYVVSAQLFVNGEMYRAESTTIEVRALHDTGLERDRRR